MNKRSFEKLKTLNPNTRVYRSVVLSFQAYTDEEIVTALIEAGVDIDLVPAINILSEFVDINLLLDSLEKLNLSVSIIFGLDLKFFPRLCKDKDKNTILFKAAAYNDYNKVKWLLENGADPNWKNSKGCLAVMDSNSFDIGVSKWILYLFLEHGMRADQYVRGSLRGNIIDTTGLEFPRIYPLLYWVKTPAFLKILTGNGGWSHPNFIPVDINKVDITTGTTAVFHSRFYNIDLLKTFAECGANFQYVNFVTGDNIISHNFEKSFGKISDEVFEFLVQQGVDPLKDNIVNILVKENLEKKMEIVFRRLSTNCRLSDTSLYNFYTKYKETASPLLKEAVKKLEIRFSTEEIYERYVCFPGAKECFICMTEIEDSTGFKMTECNDYCHVDCVKMGLAQKKVHRCVCGVDSDFGIVMEFFKKTEHLL